MRYSIMNMYISNKQLEKNGDNQIGGGPEALWNQ